MIYYFIIPIGLMAGFALAAIFYTMRGKPFKDSRKEAKRQEEWRFIEYLEARLNKALARNNELYEFNKILELNLKAAEQELEMWRKGRHV